MKEGTNWLLFIYILMGLITSIYGEIGNINGIIWIGFIVMFVGTFAIIVNWEDIKSDLYSLYRKKE